MFTAASLLFLLEVLPPVLPLRAKSCLPYQSSLSLSHPGPIMCFKVNCSKCNKITWKGCGRHVEEVLKDVPKEKLCQCPKEAKGTN